MKNQTKESVTPAFSDLGIAPTLLEALSRLKYSTPTPIQRQAIPAAIQGKGHRRHRANRHRQKRWRSESR